MSPHWQSEVRLSPSSSSGCDFSRANITRYDRPYPLATEGDFPDIVVMMNAAFPGTEGNCRWSIEEDFINGQRTDDALLREEIAGGASYLLAEENATSTLQGCVSLKAYPSEKWYLGALTVRPDLQKSGFGRRLLSAAEEYASMHGALTIEMTVVNVRSALIDWYERRGYRLTGDARPFPYDNQRYGIPTRSDLKFIALEKHLHV